MGRYDNERFALESASGGKNTLIVDDVGKPSVMVKIPRFRLSDVLAGAPNTTHPAFIVNGKDVDYIYISKYINVVEEGRAYSFAGRDPACYLDYDQATQYCAAKGAGWHLMSNAEWAAIALWCKANGFMPRGNNYCGCDMNNKWEKGVKSYDWVYASNWNNMSEYTDGEGKFHHTGRTLTGSGPASWNHDNTPFGISDLNGNVWEWVSGLRLKNGELQVIPDNNAATRPDQSDTSTQWRAILKGGTYATPGIADTLKLNGVAAGDNTQPAVSKGAMKLDVVRDKVAYTGGDVNDHFGYYYNTFETLTAAAGLTPPTLAKALGLFPADASGNEGDGFWSRNYGERLPFRGGGFYGAAGSGASALHLYGARSIVSDYVGFRSAFVPL